VGGWKAIPETMTDISDRGEKPLAKKIRGQNAGRGGAKGFQKGKKKKELMNSFF